MALKHLFAGTTKNAVKVEGGKVVVVRQDKNGKRVETKLGKATKNN